jgi:hypothetical protein
MEVAEKMLTSPQSSRHSKAVGLLKMAKAAIVSQ